MSLVRVTVFSINATILNDVLECINHQTTATAMVPLFSCSIENLTRQIMANNL